MNDLFIKQILKDTNTMPDYKVKQKPSFLDENGAGKTENDELIKKLIVTCEEGIDYTRV
jgi:hypothetical protein